MDSRFAGVESRYSVSSLSSRTLISINLSFLKRLFSFSINPTSRSFNFMVKFALIMITHLTFCKSWGSLNLAFCCVLLLVDGLVLFQRHASSMLTFLPYHKSVKITRSSWENRDRYLWFNQPVNPSVK